MVAARIGSRNFAIRTVTISGEFITLGQLLKFADIVTSGGDGRALLEDEQVTVNDEAETRRGRKIYAGDIVRVGEEELTVAKSVL